MRLLTRSAAGARRTAARCAAFALGGLLAATAAPALGASAAVDQAMRLGGTDPLGALAILERADEAGDLEASAVLANTLFFANAPRTNRPRACAIARRLADADRGDGWALLASCQLTGSVPTNDRFEATRASALRAIARGAASGGLVLFSAYVADPRAQTAHTLPLAERGRQAEAWSGLSLAVEQGVAGAAVFAMTALTDSAAPGNLQRLLDIAKQLPASERRFNYALERVREILPLGGTHAAVNALGDVKRAASSAATIGFLRDGGTACEDFDLVRTEPDALEDDAEFLPVRIGPLAKSYLVSGQWRERWTYGGCGREVAVDIEFKADGRGGATFEASAAKPSIVRRQS